MSKVLVTDTHLEDIADAIREKLGGSDTYRPGDMATAILTIPTGGGATLVPKAITQNGEYDPEDDNADGYSYVTVNVSGGGGGSTNILSGTEEPTAAQGSNGDIFLHYIGGTLPSGYTAHLFIQSSGTQFIDTGVPARVQLKVEVDCCWLSSGDQTVIGGSSNINTDAVYLGYNSTNGRTYVGYASSWHDFNSGAVDRNRHKWEIDLQTGTQTMTVDGNVFATTSNTFTETTAAGNLFLFARSNGGAKFIGQIFRVKIYDYLDSGNLIRDFVPAVRDSDGAVGMYDTVNDVFYANAGTGEFTASDNNGEIIAAYAKVNGAWQDLIKTNIDDIVTPPAPFAFHDWIGVNNTSGPFIETDYALTTDSEYEVTMQYTAQPNDNSWLFGDFAPNQQTTLGYTSGGVYIQAGGSYARAELDYNKHTYKATLLSFMRDEVALSGSPNWSNTATGVVKLFKVNTGVASANCRIYGVKIWSNANLVREFVPAIRNSDGEIGMYDTITEQFFANSGTGTFIIGDEE